MNGCFTGKAIVVTGASSGIGRAIALELGAAGAKLWLVGRNSQELEAAAAAIAERGGPPAATAPMDLRERGRLDALLREVGNRHPHLFALINNAAVMHPEPILEGTVDRWQAMFDINVLAMLEGSKAAIEVMRGHRGAGHIINIGSTQARFDVPGVYGITKRAVEAIGETLRQELEQDDIRVTTIVPGGFTTQLGRGLTAESKQRYTDYLAARGLERSDPRMDRLLADPQHIARLIAYILQQPIDINIQEVVIRPPVSIRL